MASHMDDTDHQRDLPPLAPKHLLLIKWISGENLTLKKIKIAESVAPKWREIATLIGLSGPKIASIENPGSGRQPIQCVSEVFRIWGEEPNRDAEDYPYSWEGLLELLGDIEHNTLADDLREAMSSQQSSIRGTFGQLSMRATSDIDEAQSIESGNSKVYWILFGVVVLVVLLIVWRYHTEIMHQIKVSTYSRTLPYLSKNFVGREDEVKELLDLLDFTDTEERIIDIIGSPGIGKSTLAIKIGNELVDKGVYVHYVDLVDFPSHNIELVLAEKILKSTVKIYTFDRLLDWAEEQSKDTLLILDNVLFEQKDSLQIALPRLVKASTSIKVIMTSRDILIALEHYSWYKVYELSRKAAISLLEQKLTSLNLTLQEKEKIAELTGNVPLVLHIVGSLMTLPDPLTPALVIEELTKDPVNFLSPKELPMELRINASFSLSYRYLEDNLKMVAYFLAFFPGSFNKDAAIGTYEEYLVSSNGIITMLEISHSELRTLVERSLLEYNERTGRYQYHRLIREFLLLKTKELRQKVNYNTFSQSFRLHFLRQLHQHTVDFKLKFVDSLKFLDTERHNIFSLLKDLQSPADLPRRSLLTAVDVLTHAIDVGYLKSRFTSSELIACLLNTVAYLDNHVKIFHERASPNTKVKAISGREWTQKEYYQRVYIQLVITMSDILKEKEGEHTALSFMETRKRTVDHLSKGPRENSRVSRQGILDPKQNPDSIPKSTEVKRRAFYINLGNLHLALGQHESVVKCQLRILEDVEKCRKENCTYRQIGMMYMNVADYEQAATFLELSLKHDGSDIISRASTLVQLVSVYQKLREWLWTSQKEKDTISHLFRVSKELLQTEEQALFFNWKIMFKIIKIINLAGSGLNAHHLEERLFKITSNPNKLFQLQPKDALQLLSAVVLNKNHTKTMLWGSLLLRPFENYQNFSTEEMLNVLKIRVVTASSKIHLWQIFEGLREMESVYSTVVQYPALQQHPDSAQIHDTACFYLIPSIKYVFPCYREKIINAIKIALETLLFTVPRSIAFITFFLPFDFFEQQLHIDEDMVLTTAQKSKDIATTNSQLYELVEVLASSTSTNIKSIVLPMCYDVAVSYSWLLIKFFNIFVVILNVLSICVRFWILFTLFSILTGISIVFLSLVLEKNLLQMYQFFILRQPSYCSNFFLLWIDKICDLLIFFSIVQVKWLQNAVGFPWLTFYIIISKLNLGQLHDVTIGACFHFHSKHFLYRLSFLQYDVVFFFIVVTAAVIAQFFVLIVVFVAFSVLFSIIFAFC